MAAECALEVTSPGSLATVQDLGRPGWGRWGVPPGGALDTSALRVANILVGNPAGAAGVEVTLMGFAVTVRRPVVVAVTGGDLDATLNDRPIETWRSHYLVPGDVLRFRRPRAGCRAYLAVGGGIHVPTVLGSASTALSSGFGGYEGRPLARGDQLHVLTPERHLSCAGRAVSPPPPPPSPRVLRAIGTTHPGAGTLFDTVYTVSPLSGRAGVRLAGAALRGDGAMLSTGVVAGCVQITPEGQPVVTLVETVTGGYPVGAVVIGADLGLVAQLKPGDTVILRRTTESQARAALRALAAALEDLEHRYAPLTG